MVNHRKISTYLMQALIHKTKTPLATIQNDMEYLMHTIQNDEMPLIYNSVKNSIHKINCLVDNAFFILNNQAKENERFPMSYLKNVEALKLDNIDEFNINVTLNKNDIFSYFELLVKILKSFNLLVESCLTFTLTKNISNNKFSISSYFKQFENEDLIDGTIFNSLFEYINIKNNIDSIDTILSDILLDDLGLTIELKSQNKLMYFSIKGFSL